MIKNVIFDCGRVLIHYDTHYICSHFADNEEDIRILSEIGMSRKYWSRFDLGTLSDAEYLREVRTEIPEHLHFAAEAVLNSWTKLCPPIDGMNELVLDLKERGVGLYLLSNFGKRLRADIDTCFPILGELDGIVISSELGITKPDQRIYRHTLEKYGLAADECVFIDDVEDNVRAAESLGIHGYVFDGDATSLREFFLKEGIL